MRDFKGMKRQRGRNRKPGGGNGGNANSANPNRSWDSQGPENIKVRGNAQTVYERYMQLARDATSGGDRVLAENYLQHAEHYFRVLRALQPARPVSEIAQRELSNQGFDIDFEDESGAQAAAFLAAQQAAERQAQYEAERAQRQAEQSERGETQNRDQNRDQPRDRDRDYQNRDYQNREPREAREPRAAQPQGDGQSQGQGGEPRADGEPREGGRRETRRERWERRRDERYRRDDDGEIGGADAEQPAETVAESAPAPTPVETTDGDALPGFLTRPSRATRKPAAEATASETAEDATPGEPVEEAPKRTRAPRRRAAAADTEA
ncbi:hypothetical protein ASG17_01675 [Brevundimonas sp. Leaf363]|uniref:DUF4167 domain-containing protein n=1 Tax=Brevundimonas sp. Leaf363 TaxID=1736353 RepID=UPI0006FE5702|nr:DUF4167 domain-containing protein [Brevundimonas sp. Leaf363]KQS57458.1 hypothetical protein ASG17_01675 [Brevundimonas sp. Leaf363]